ncbi:MAG: DEAD/DEAH box helicase [Methanocellales archaeon]|nr:DEAD/DEAH box helicase [Methanocellales archaeon]
MMTAFDYLDSRIKEALRERDFLVPTEPQEKAIPIVLRGKNVLLIAPTGSGKTESAVLPIFHHLIQRNKKGISALYITPLRALNRDMLKRMKWWSTKFGIDISVRHGDTSDHERRRQATNPPDMLITTPETLQAMLTGRRLRENLADVSYVVVDEVHEIASSQRGAQLAIGLERLVEVAGEFQRIGLSATVGSPEEIAKFFVGADRDAEIIEVSVSKLLDFKVISPSASHEDIKKAKRMMTDPEIVAHLSCMSDLIERHKSTLIFVNTRQSAEALGSRFRMLGSNIGVHHSSLSKDMRVEAEDAFKRGDLKALICTSSMELGIDIGKVDQVIQYASPKQVTRLLQRVGRSGHKVGETSKGTIITTNTDDIAEAWAIVHRAYENEIESIELHDAGDTLANQICGMALQFGQISLEKILSIIRRSYPFRKTTHELLLQIIQQLKEQRLIWFDENTVGQNRRTRQYFYENLSMIPDKKNYDIYDVIGGRFIGTLDEAFVVNFASHGATFITKGDMWRIVEMAEDQIKVEPVEDPSGEIPSWVGEEIPVPYEVAQEVGRIRARVASMLEKKEDAVEELMKTYPTDASTAKKLIKLVQEQIKGNYPIPTDSCGVIECENRKIIINACLGHKVNETLGRVIASLLTARFGSSVAMEIDPYRIELELPRKLSAIQIRNLIMDIKPEYIEPIIEMTLKSTALFKWKMVHVARKFGVFSRDTDYRFIDDKLLNVFTDTPLYDATMREIFQDKLNIPRAEEVLEKMLSGEIELVTSGISPIGLAGQESSKELIAPEKADGSILLALKERIMNDRIILFCVNCKKWISQRKVKQVPERPECPLCNSRMIAALKPWEKEEIKITKRSDKLRSEEDKKRVQRVYGNANLVLSHGKTAVIALASRGLGPKSASRVIRRLRDEEDFYREILMAEREYTKTKRFWHD